MSPSDGNQAPLAFALILDEFSASWAKVPTMDGDEHRMLRLHFKVQRHERGKPVTLQALPPIYVPAQVATQLPTAMLAAVERELPHLAPVARAELQAALGSSGSTPDD